MAVCCIVCCFLCPTCAMGSFCFFFFLMIRRPPRSTLDRSSAASDVYKRQLLTRSLRLGRHRRRRRLASTRPAPGDRQRLTRSWPARGASGVRRSELSENAYKVNEAMDIPQLKRCLLYTSPSPRDRTRSRMPSSA